MQKLRKSAELWEEGGQLVEVVKGHGDVFGVSAHVDDLWPKTTDHTPARAQNEGLSRRASSKPIFFEPIGRP